MRNYYFLAVLAGLLFMGCSVDNDELNFNENQIQTANLEINEICMPSIYGIEDSGKLLGNVIIINSDDGGIAYINFISETGFYITEIRLMIADDLSGLPHNNGGIIPGKLEKLTYDSVSEVNFEYSVSNSFVLAARVTFTNSDGKKFTKWVGDETSGNNSSTYLSYTVCISPEPICEADAGSDNSRTYTDSEIDELIDDLGAIEPLFKTLLDKGISHDGTFKPTGPELLRLYNQNHYQDFKTIYTVTNELNGEVCSDSVELIITIIP